MNIKKNEILVIIILNMLPLLLIFFLDYTIDDIYIYNFILNAVLLSISINMLIVYYLKTKFDLFEPLLLISVLHFFIFYITPMYDIVIGEYSWFGVNDLFDYGIKGSLVAFAGYVSFYIIYNLKFKVLNMFFLFKMKKWDNKYLVPSILTMFAVCLVLYLYYIIIVSGNSIMYLLTLGFFGSSSDNTISSSGLGAISMFGFCLPSLALLYQEYGKIKSLKIALYFLVIQLFIARGFRFLILQIVIIMVSYYFIRYNKKPKFKQTLIIALITMIPIIIMTMFRNDIRSGVGFSFNRVDFNSIIGALDEAIWDNFRIYKTYYSLIKAVPEMTGYLFGEGIIAYTAIMFIPRGIWPGKPLNPQMDAVGLGLSVDAVKAGQAYPNIGEFYYDSGILGVIFWMGIYACITKYFRNRFRNNAKSVVDIMAFSTMLGINLQLVIRGYTPSNFWMVVFSMLPLILVKMFFDGTRKEKDNE